jgi:hypothetical protein
LEQAEAPAEEAGAALLTPEENATPAPAEVAKNAPCASALRKTSYALLGASGATALMGTVFALMANSNHRSYKKRYSSDDNARAIRADADPVAARKLKDKISTQKTIAIVSVSVAGAAAIAGTTLFFLSPEWQTKSVSVGFVPTQGGAVLSMQGTW